MIYTSHRLDHYQIIVGIIFSQVVYRRVVSIKGQKRQEVNSCGKTNYKNNTNINSNSMDLKLSDTNTTLIINNYLITTLNNLNHLNTSINPIVVMHIHLVIIKRISIDNIKMNRADIKHLNTLIDYNKRRKHPHSISMSSHHNIMAIRIISILNIIIVAVRMSSISRKRKLTT